MGELSAGGEALPFGRKRPKLLAQSAIASHPRGRHGCRSSFVDPGGRRENYRGKHLLPAEKAGVHG